MIYILAFFLPPLGLLFNGQPFSAILNVPCLLLGLIVHPLLLVPSLHAIIAIAMQRREREHRELVQAVARHGPPPHWMR